VGANLVTKKLAEMDDSTRRDSEMLLQMLREK